MATQKKVIYIAGKVTGLPIHEVTLKFGDAQVKLQDAGFEVINPLAVVNDWHCTWQHAMRKCIAALMTADAVFVLPCSVDSKGASIEMTLCAEIKIPLFASVKGLKDEFKTTK